MIRLEIVAAQAVQQDLIELCEKEKIIPHYTVIPEVQGKGFSGSKLGDSVWPEKNFVFVAYCSQQEAEVAKRVVARMKKRFPTEGIVIFASQAVEIS